MVCFFSLFYSSIALIWGARFVNKRQTLTAVPNKQAQFKPVRLMVPKKKHKGMCFCCIILPVLHWIYRVEKIKNKNKRCSNAKHVHVCSMEGTFWIFGCAYALEVITSHSSLNAWNNSWRKAHIIYRSPQNPQMIAQVYTVHFCKCVSVFWFKTADSSSNSSNNTH